MASVPPERMKKAPAQRAKLHFLLAWFHAVTVDRLRFSPLGWSTYYEFNASDLRCGFNTFDAWLDRTAEGRDHLDPTKIPWTALRTLLGQAFYGGRVDNLFDQRVMFSFLDQIFVPGAYEDGFNLANLPDRLPFLTLPASSKREDFVQFIEELAKQSESPEWLGLPETAETMLRTVKGRDTCLRIGKLQGDAGGGDDDSEEGGGGERARVAKQMVEFSEHILAQLPESLGDSEVDDDGTGEKTSLERYFEREMKAAVSMLKMLRKDLTDLRLVAEGEIRSTNRTRDIQDAAIIKGEVPDIWKKYPTPPMTVNPWVADYVQRCNQLVEVAAQVKAGAKAGEAGLSTPVWMGAFFMPGAFLTATQQSAAKVLESSMEQLKMIVDVISDGEPEYTEGAPAGSQYLVTGAFLEAAGWADGALALSNEMVQRMPTIRLTWLVDAPGLAEGRVEVPIYLNSTRKQLITVALLKTPEGIGANTWYQRGTCVQLWRG